MKKNQYLGDKGKKVLMRIELMSIKYIERKKESAIYNDLSDRVGQAKLGLRNEHRWSHNKAKRTQSNYSSGEPIDE